MVLGRTTYQTCYIGSDTAVATLQAMREIKEACERQCWRAKPLFELASTPTSPNISCVCLPFCR